MLTPWWELPADLAVIAVLFVFYFYVTRRVRRQTAAAIKAATIWVAPSSCTHSCPHMTIIGVTSASCSLCGPLATAP